MFTYAQVSGGLRLDYTLGDQQTLDDVAWGMLANNEIPGIQPVRRSQLDNKVVLHYDIAGQSTLRELIGRPLRRADVVWILGSLVAALSSAESYMIAMDRFILDPELVFVDSRARTVSLICVPVSTALPSDPLVFFKKVTCDLRYDESEESGYSGELMATLNAQSTLDLARFAKAIRSAEMRTAVPTTGGAPHPPVAQSASPPPGHPGEWAHAPAVPSPFAPAPTVAASAPARGLAGPSAGPEPAQRPGPVPLPSSPHAAPPPVQHGSNTLGFSVPGRPLHLPASAPQAPVRKGPKVRGKAPVAPNDEPAVGLLYLLQHYSKENKELYDRQRQARAALKANSKSVPAEMGGMPPFGVGHPPVPSQPQHQMAPAMAPPVGGPSPYPAGGPVPTAPAQHDLPAGAPVHGMDVPDGFGETVYFGGLGAAAGLEASRLAAAADQAPPPAGTVAGLVPAPPVASTVPNASLRNSQTGETVRIEKQVFVIGRGRSGVDYVLRDRTVSNSHAIIYANSDGYSIIDNNSLNGVYVDGRQIVPVQRAALPPEAEIRIGDEVVIFRIDR